MIPYANRRGEVAAAAVANDCVPSIPTTTVVVIVVGG